MTKKSNSNKTGAIKPRLTKKAQLIHMLSTQSGADLAVISGKLGWQIHTTRAAITGLRKAGFAVETKIILADTPAGIDETLVRNVAKAHAWFERIKAGETFTEIAAAESMHKNRIQQMICPAFLAPDIVRDVLDGKQPLGFTSDWCKSNTLPAHWHDQRRLLATL